MTLTVGALWRYPIKTLGGERLDVAELTTSGIVGDRIVHVRGPEGVRTSRRHHNLLGLHATLGPDGEPIVDGHNGLRPMCSIVSVPPPGQTRPSLASTVRSGSTSCPC